MANSKYRDAISTKERGLVDTVVGATGKTDFKELTSADLNKLVNSDGKAIVDPQGRSTKEDIENFVKDIKGSDIFKKKDTFAKFKTAAIESYVDAASTGTFSTGEKDLEREKINSLSSEGLSAQGKQSLEKTKDAYNKSYEKVKNFNKRYEVTDEQGNVTFDKAAMAADLSADNSIGKEAFETQKQFSESLQVLNGSLDVTSQKVKDELSTSLEKTSTLFDSVAKSGEKLDSDSFRNAFRENNNTANDSIQRFKESGKNKVTDAENIFNELKGKVDFKGISESLGVNISSAGDLARQDEKGQTYASRILAMDDWEQKAYGISGREDTGKIADISSKYSQGQTDQREAAALSFDHNSEMGKKAIALTASGNPFMQTAISASALDYKSRQRLLDAVMGDKQKAMEGFLSTTDPEKRKMYAEQVDAHEKTGVALGMGQIVQKQRVGVKLSNAFASGAADETLKGYRDNLPGSGNNPRADSIPGLMKPLDGAGPPPKPDSFIKMGDKVVKESDLYTPKTSGGTMTADGKVYSASDLPTHKTTP
jgi:hypothetical protein